VHGGAAPQVARKRRERVALAEAAAAGDRRHPALVLLHATHLADTVMLEAIGDASADGQDVLDAVERAATLAKDALKLGATAEGAAAELQQAENQYAELIAGVMRVALAAAGCDAAQQRRVEEELAKTLRRLDGRGGERAVLVEAERLGRALPPADGTWL
jgi:hypothetical protein